MFLLRGPLVAMSEPICKRQGVDEKIHDIFKVYTNTCYSNNTISGNHC